METIDSKKKQLDPPEIIARSVEQLAGQENKPSYAIMLAIAKEMSGENVDRKQIGNTVFITHMSRQNGGKLYGVGRAFNVDTANNFISNGLKFFTHLQSIGMRQYVTFYQGTTYDAAFKAFKRVADNTPIAEGNTKSEIHIRPTEDGQTVAVVTLGTEPLHE